MRVLFWILLAGNIVFFTLMQRGGWAPGADQAAHAQPPLHEDQVRLLDIRELAAEPEPESAPALADTQAGVCMEWGEFSGTDLARAGAALAALQLGDKLGRREIEHSIGYWVYIPPLKDKAAVSQKILQLKARGVQEHFVVTEPGIWLNAISLGVFKTQEAAQNFLDSLRNKDVRSAQAGERASKFKVTVFTLGGIDAQTGDKLAAMHKDFAGSELKNVPCTLTR
ncbi:MAG: hypothetical protein A2Z95_02425 [Gallionellales bacterium GWA2_60_18]|nr:MAG: hypothetical protein A2Z95_02425 [Gallionellales bacterium GWA2_60_18]